MAIQTLKIWLKAFIPYACEGAVPVPGEGPHQGKTMLLTPGPVDACFLTDERGFSDDIQAKARMHSEMEIQFHAQPFPQEVHWCSDTVQVDCATGEELCRETPDNSHMRFSNFKASQDGRHISFDLKASSKNSCLKLADLKLSPNLDYEGTFHIMVAEGNARAVISFDGKIEVYPAFEMYVSVNGGPPQSILREDVVSGKTPLDLAGKPARPVKCSLEVSA
jgi:hypothetical protein